MWFGIGVILGITFVFILRGFVLSILWAWFLVPLGVPPIGIAGAIGVTLMIDMFIPTNSGKSTTEAISIMLITPLMVLLIAWITVQFI